MSRSMWKCRIAVDAGHVVEFDTGPEALASLVEEAVGDVEGVVVDDVALQVEEGVVVVAEEDSLLVVVALVVIEAMVIQASKRALHRVVAQRQVRLETVLQAAHQLVEQDVVHQRPRLLDEDLGQRPVVVAQLESLVQHRFGDVERASRASHVERLVLASMVEDEQVRALHEGDGDVVVEQGVDEVVGQLADGAIEKLDDVVAGVKPRQASVGKQHTVAQACLLAEDDGHVAPTDHLVDLGVGHDPFAQSRVRTLVA